MKFDALFYRVSRFARDKNIVTELSESNNITTDVNYLKSVMSVIWIKVLTMIHEVNLITQSRNAILDVKFVNIDLLRANIQKLRDK